MGIMLGKLPQFFFFYKHWMCKRCYLGTGLSSHLICLFFELNCISDLRTDKCPHCLTRDTVGIKRKYTLLSIWVLKIEGSQKESREYLDFAIFQEGGWLRRFDPVLPWSQSLRILKWSLVQFEPTQWRMCFCFSLTQVYTFFWCRRYFGVFHHIKSDFEIKLLVKYTRKLSPYEYVFWIFL